MLSFRFFTGGFEFNLWRKGCWTVFEHIERLILLLESQFFKILVVISLSILQKGLNSRIFLRKAPKTIPNFPVTKSLPAINIPEDKILWQILITSISLSKQSTESPHFMHTHEFICSLPSYFPNDYQLTEKYTKIT